jgi:hypothetical protein
VRDCSKSRDGSIRWCCAGLTRSDIGVIEEAARLDADMRLPLR